MIAASVQISRATTSNVNKDGMLSIALTHSKIKEVLESFLNNNNNDNNDNTHAIESQPDNPSSPAILLDDLFMDFGLRIRIIVQQRQRMHTTIAVHLGIIGVGVIKDQCLRHLKKIFGQENVDASDIKSTDFHPLRTVAEGFDICVRVISDDLPPNLTAEQACVILSNLHVTILGGDLKHAFNDLANGKKHEPLSFSIPIQSQRPPIDNCNPQCVVVQKQNDRITATFPFVYPLETDCALAKLFLQQFQPAQRKCLNQRHGKFVPMVDYFRSNDPPREIRGFGNDNEDIHHAGYLSLTFLEHHVDTEEKIHKAATNVLMLHTFLDYHIKCAKSNLNSRMRAKKEALERKLFD